MIRYFDTAYIAKCYLTEPDAARRRAAAGAASQRVSSAICLAEMACVFHRCVREGYIPARDAWELHQTFLDDIRGQYWTLIPVTEMLLHRASAAVRRLAPRTALRAYDAIHIISAQHHGLSEIWSNDRRLLAAAGELGLDPQSA